ncbi:hypothetical protein RD792_001688 [Penstemon davidsonii]|uniref:Protein kinase domain-containing protein n=1 Tax=Penstemon davidsonii TaxID=160366 RepID=A0ABR0DP11_9LAMI|nr:hypothetical protein RD792_001688 [Penstemon davidsonii]
MQMSSALHFSYLVIPLWLSWSVANDIYSSGSDDGVEVYSNMSLAEGDHITKPGCPSKCGNLTVPYPFGVGINSGCSINPFFDISCNASFNPPKAFLGSDQLEVEGIYDTKIYIKNRPAFNCFDKSGNLANESHFSMNLSGTPFSLSNENKLTVIGCDDVSELTTSASDYDNYLGLCVAICNKTQDLSNGSCSGIGCCQASIPKGLQVIYLEVTKLNDQNAVQSFNPCGYAFLAEQNSYEFQISDISVDSSLVNKTIGTLPLVIDWAIGHRNCNQIQNTKDFICQGKSVCVDSDTGLGGYQCNCSQGYKGNPYLSPGCQGSYNCSCNHGYYGDGGLDGTGCFFVPSPTKNTLYAGLLIGSVSFLALLLSFWVYKVLKRRKANKLKLKYFKRNGGLMLQQQISAHDHVLEKIRNFTAKELERATDRFNESRIIGKGGQGTVYKGMLSDGRIIAVKKSKQIDKNDQLAEFINEVVILSQINHRNVVKLLGCCLETEVPLLFYEFISNGTLFDLIHDQSTGFPFSWEMRLRIAAEVANALSYLHHATSVPIYHRDMKTNNILLDEKYRAKLADFGISKSVTVDHTHLTTKVKGTFGYLDPEYFQTSKFTGKSDVYSFGVVLVELLTGQKPISTSVTEEERSLVTRFLLTMEENRLQTILDSQIIEQSIDEEILTVAKLAKRCLNLNGRKRPNIKEVAMELDSIRTCENPSIVESNIQEISWVETESLEFSEYRNA